MSRQTELERAKAIIAAGFTLPCGHHSESLTFDYHSDYCKECGAGVDVKLVTPPEVKAARQVIYADYYRRDQHKGDLLRRLKEELTEFLRDHPEGSLEQFYLQKGSHAH